MATVKKIKKAQDGKSLNSDVPSWVSKVNKQTLAEIKNPKLGDVRRAKEDSTMKSNFAKGRALERTNRIKEGYKVEDRPSGSTVYTKQKNGGKISCWKGYAKQGTKKKGGKTVNNCVKKK